MEELHGGYRKSKDLGRHTFDIEASRPQLLDRFLNVICSRDPGVAKPTTRLLQGDGFSGVMVDNTFALFANDRGNLTAVDVVLPVSPSLKGVLVDLVPNTTYYYQLDANRLRVSTTGRGGLHATSSKMGVLKIEPRLDNGSRS